MDGLDLRPNEVVIMENDSVARGDERANLDGSLILTNQSLVYIRRKRGAFGGVSVKDTKRYPLGQIKVYQGRAQVRTGRARNGYPQVEIYLIGGQETFLFNKKKDAQTWAEALNDVINGVPVEASPSDGMSNPDLDSLVGAFGAVFGSVTDSFKSAFDDGADSSKSDTRGSRTTNKCSYCGAPISGTRGQIVRCRYCDTEQTLK